MPNYWCAVWVLYESLAELANTLIYSENTAVNIHANYPKHRCEKFTIEKKKKDSKEGNQKQSNIMTLHLRNV